MCERSGNLNVAVSVDYATSNGSAVAGPGLYDQLSGTLVFPSNATDESFTVTILANSNRSTPTSTFNLTLQPTGRWRDPGLDRTATVTITNQSNPDSRHSSS